MRLKYFGFIGCLYCFFALSATGETAAAQSKQSRRYKDTTPPSIVFTAPATGAKVPYLAWVGGWVRDNPGGSGIARVQMLLTRKTGGKTYYWGGYDWWSSDAARRTAQRPDLYPGNWAELTQAQLSGARWNYPRRLLPNRHIQPNSYSVSQIGPKLFSGLYIFRVTAYDRAGNSKSILRRVRVVVDTTLPRIGFIWPRQNAVVSQFPALKGWARDRGGSGLDRVEITVWRKWDKKTWTGDQWHSGNHLTTLPAVLANGRWQLKRNLPQGKSLLPGRYEIWAAAYDKAGNRSGLRYFDYGIGPDGSHPYDIRNIYASTTLHVR